MNMLHEGQYNGSDAFASCPDPSVCLADQSNDADDPARVGLAFALTLSAGLATAVGAAIPFLPCITPTSTKYLSIGMGLSGGVMVYVSFTEILKDSMAYFCCITPTHYHLATLCFFFLGATMANLFHAFSMCFAPGSFLRRRICCCLPDLVDPHHAHGEIGVELTDTMSTHVQSTRGPGDLVLRSGVPPSSSDVRLDALALDTEPPESKHSEDGITPIHIDLSPTSLLPVPGDDIAGGDSVTALPAAVEESEELLGHAERQKLHTTGLITGITIFIHNLPEGLLTLVGTLAAPRLGVALAIAVACK
jgi:zinc transporter ZupT